nr:MAG TPA: hypothetical protein [Caudoviricetes sp.]
MASYSHAVISAPLKLCAEGGEISSHIGQKLLRNLRDGLNAVFCEDALQLHSKCGVAVHQRHSGVDDLLKGDATLLRLCRSDGSGSRCSGRLRDELLGHRSSRRGHHGSSRCNGLGHHRRGYGGGRSRLLCRGSDGGLHGCGLRHGHRRLFNGGRGSDRLRRGRSRSRRCVRGSFGSSFLAAGVFCRSGGDVSALAFDGLGQMVDGGAQFGSVNGYFQFDHGVLPPKFI